MQGPGVRISCRPSGAAEAVACSIRSPTAMYRATQIHQGPTVSPGPPQPQLLAVRSPGAALALPSWWPFLSPCCLPAALLFADGARPLCEHRG